MEAAEAAEGHEDGSIRSLMFYEVDEVDEHTILS